MITLCKTGCFQAGAKDLPEALRAAGYEVRLETCLDRCAHCDRGEIVGRVGEDWVAQGPALGRSWC